MRRDDDDLRNAWTMDNSTSASNPGRVKVNLGCWILHKPRWPAIWTSSFLAALALAMVVHWAFWFAAVPLLLMNLLYWVRITEQFKSGCTNPAIVVAVKPTLIAVSTDLTQGIGQYPAIKILEVPLQRIDGRPVSVGMRLATVAGYIRNADPNQPHWDDFDPHPVQLVTFDQAVVDRVLSSIPEVDWLDLDDGLRQVRQPYLPGLYMVRPRIDSDEDLEDHDEWEDEENALARYDVTQEFLFSASKRFLEASANICRGLFLLTFVASLVAMYWIPVDWTWYWIALYVVGAGWVLGIIFGSFILLATNWWCRNTLIPLAEKENIAIEMLLATMRQVDSWREAERRRLGGIYDNRKDIIKFLDSKAVTHDDR